MVVDIPKDVTADSTEYHYPESIEIRSYKPVTRGHPIQIKRAAVLIGAAKRLATGGGGSAAGW